MVKEQHPCVTRAAPGVLPLTAAATGVLVLLFLWTPVAGAGAAAEQQQRITVGGNNTTSLCNVDGNAAAEGGGGEDGGCLSLPFIAHAQPQLEGFDMASDLGSSAAVVKRTNPYVTLGTRDRRRAVCGRNKSGRYISCTTDPSKVTLRKCGPFSRDC